jgi:fibronectin type 3 domain-containing protein
VAGASGYNVYRGTTSGGPYTKLTASPVTAPAYQDLAIVAGTTYYYCTTAIVNGVESAYAVQVPVTIPTP